MGKATFDDNVTKKKKVKTNKSDNNKTGAVGTQKSDID